MKGFISKITVPVLMLLAMATVAAAEPLDSATSAWPQYVPAHERPDSNRFLSCTGAYYDWGQAQNGWGYCYQWTCDGRPLNGGRPVGNYLCEANQPSHYGWGRAQNGWGYCYRWTPKGVAMNGGQPVGNYLCEAVAPSSYRWGTGMDGHARCYQWSPEGYALNQGRPVANYLCGG
ncbi:MAG: hypothetical protein AB7G93_13600 [Bdellovibrionales bacterium]